MGKKEALETLRNHTQHFVPVADLEALYMAIEALEREVENEDVRIKNTYSAKGYPMYTNRFMELANFYIKDGELLKNRGENFVNQENEMVNCNNIVVEDNGIVNIYCKSDKVEHYKIEIEFLKRIYPSIEDRIIINSK